jgi:spore germination cell wall hydrolase CwlJ-like protein
MIALAHRLRVTIAGHHLEGLAFAVLALALAAALALGVATRSTADAASVTVPITAAKAAQLIDATTGDQAAQVRAVGEQAKLINAALPFASGPLLAARPFAVSGGEIDQRRALLCLTQAVYYEAGFEPVDGRQAVAQVVLNRMRHPAFPKSVCGVVYQNHGRICQFTFVCDGALNRAPAPDAWRRAQEVARSALAGFVDTSVGAATHYHADYVAPRWAPMLAKVAKIGQHIFYRWPGAWGQPAAFTGRYAGEPRDPLALRPVLPAKAAETLAVAMLEQTPSGPPIPRAENDVGGLLDTTKGWTLRIPGPDDSASAARLIASQEGKKPAAPAAPAVATAASGVQVASR